MAFLSSLFGAVAFAAGSFLVKTVINTYIPEENSQIHEVFAISPRKTFLSIKETNSELEELRQQEARYRFIRERDRERILELERERDRLYLEYETYKHNDALRRAENNPRGYTTFQITPEKLHILQYHAGETVIGKKCSICHRPMILQFSRGKMMITMNDLFWACSGYYFNACSFTQNFPTTDLNLFAQDDKKEFHITNRQLADILEHKRLQEYTAYRMRQHRGGQIDDYVCPIHKEPLILREKKASGGILDAFFLGCPRWSSHGDRCKYVQKLKSPAQLASYLYKTENKGLF